ncbi:MULTISPECIES: SulP family inorganic anion transporter [Mycobacteriaceae]|uniref:MFS transporter n=1 Tax=Mycolicibacterium neoaurum VKM Ac-1815D TaxID=700508 RepID=V5XF27_MYCNE|nr:MULTISPECIES: SulP family inorganic anion transporter [Mycobacteriaceae]AHC26014.1 MFS transporter [Mycolicibacterium neoaurum VKM Ac-1815D]AMO06407.1 MFS transporter [Mycolicibacterium neoaurum]AXK75247.1 SulP family inorganic anion transporter [Mycolicibacterium neoaurum]KJQ51077.1 MFS transporter [Mycolicibacterium neoaurum]KUM08388.1 MFS transporter [Mycolicibacterium neoaurum]
MKPSRWWTTARALLPGARDYVGLRSSWRRDVLAGITVGVVALPLALAFGISSGVGAAAGLVTAIVAGIVAAVFGGSHVQVSGPTGAMAVVLAPVVAQHGLSSVAIVTILAGAMVFVAGATGVGRLVTVIPWPVIEGFTLGIAVIIFLQQVPAAVGAAAPEGLRPLAAALEALTTADGVTARWALLVVAVVIVVMVGLRRLLPTFPSSLVAVIVASVVVSVAALPIPRIGELPAGLPVPTWPQADLAAMKALFGAALAIAALAAIESLLSARVAASLSGTAAGDPDRELVGQGMASVAAGLFGGMPATGAIARTAVNVKAGARTRIAALTHSVLLIGVVYLLSGPVGAIPLAALAAVLMVTAVTMISGGVIVRILRSGRSGALIFVVTAGVTVCLDLIQAVELGMLVAALFALAAMARRSGVHREALPGPYRPGDEHIMLLRLDGAMFFGAAERMSATIAELAVSGPAVVIIRMSGLHHLDATGAHALSRITGQLESRGTMVIIKGVDPEQHDLLTNVGILESLRHETHLMNGLDEAIAHARAHVHRENAVTAQGWHHA